MENYNKIGGIDMLYDVEKVIRVLGYMVYVALWSPVIVVLLPVMSVIWLVQFKRIGFTTKEAMKTLCEAFKTGIMHDVNFIKTGVW